MTIKEIAARAGVSTATVSRVLNDPGYRCAREGVRERIWDIAMEMNYVPNEAARNLKLRTAAVAPAHLHVLMTRAGAPGDSDPFFRELLHYVETEITAGGCVLSSVQYRAEYSDDKRCARLDADAHVRKMLGGLGEQCDGIIVIGKCNKRVLQALRQQDVNVVAINRNSAGHAVDEVLCDGAKMASAALEYLMALGHRRIGYVGNCRNESRYRGYQDTLRAHGLDLIPGYVAQTSQTEEEGYQAMCRFLRQSDMPTALYCANDLSALGVLRCLGEHRQLPLRPSVVASDDVEAAQRCTPSLSTVSVPKREMAHLAVQLLLDRHHGGHNSPVRVEVESKLVQRESCFACEEL